MQSDSIKSEEWRDIPGFPGYQVSSLAHVRSFWHRQGARGSVFSAWEWAIGDTPRPLAIRRNKKGYHIARLKDHAGKSHPRPVHVLMLLAFVGPRPAKAYGRHLDDDKERNTLDNLAWGTSKENRQDAVRNSRCHTAKLTPDDVRRVRALLAEGMTQAAIARLMNVGPSSISVIATGRCWRSVT